MQDYQRKRGPSAEQRAFPTRHRIPHCRLRSHHPQCWHLLVRDWQPVVPDPESRSAGQETVSLWGLVTGRYSIK